MRDRFSTQDALPPWPTGIPKRVSEMTPEQLASKRAYMNARSRLRRRLLSESKTAEERAATRRWREAQSAEQRKKRERTYSLKTRYGITLNDFEALLAAQGGGCAICSIKFDDNANVDHCHETGRVRGLLCSACNTAIGRLGDNLDGVMRAVRYLERA